MSLNERQLQDRRSFVGGSDARTIMNGSEKDIVKLWEEKLGLREPEDLSFALEVQIGLATEPLNYRMYEHTTGRVVTRRQDEVISWEHPHMASTLDGVDETFPGGAAVIECKHCSPWMKPQGVIDKYYPQLVHNMVVTGLRKAAISVIRGTHDYDIFELPWDEEYAEQLIKAEAAFMRAVLNGDPPVISQVRVPVVIEKTKRIDMAASNSWAESAARWLQNREAAKLFETAAEDLKQAFKAADQTAGEAWGHGIVATRNSRGAVTISEATADAAAA